MSDDIDRSGAMLTRRKFALGLAFASVAGVAAARLPNKSIDYLGKNKLEDILPQRVGRWNYVSNSGLVVPPEDQMSRALYSQLVTRVYSDRNGPPIMLLVAQSATQTGILQIHSFPPIFPLKTPSRCVRPRENYKTTSLRLKPGGARLQPSLSRSKATPAPITTLSRQPPLKTFVHSPPRC